MSEIIQEPMNSSPDDAGRRRKIDIPPSAWFGIVIIACYVFVAVFATLIAPYGESEVFDTAFAPWNSEFLLGTDHLGRDVLTRLIYGARNTIGIAFIATCLSFLVGVTLGMTVALVGGVLDQIVGRAIDVFMAIPGLILSLMLLSMFGSSIPNLIILIALIDAVYVTRLSRAVSLATRHTDFVEVARLRGEGLGWIIFREILPNISPVLVVEFGLRFCFVFLTIAALSFLGVGIQPPTADWGSMVRENASLIGFADLDLLSALTPLIPAAAIALLTVAVNLVADAYTHYQSGLNDQW